MSWRDRMNGWHRDGAAAEPAVESALATIDDALESGRVSAMDPEDRQLQELALSLRAESPPPRREFARELDERVASGFPRERPGALGRLARRIESAGSGLRRHSRPVVAGAGSLLVALAVALSLYASQREDATPPDGGAEPALAPAEPDAAGEGSQRIEALAPTREAPGATADDSIASGRENRRVERSARMTLAAPADELQDVAEGIATVADQRGGFLLRSSLTTGSGDATGGSFELRVPVDELEPVLAALSELAEVRSLTQAGEDLTARFVSRDDALEATHAELDRLERRLASAATEEEQDRLRARIEATQAEIRALRRNVDRLRERTSFATIAIALEQGDEGDGLGAAVDDAIGTFGGAVEVGVRALGVAVPLAVVAAIVWLAGRAVRRRRRESALA
jgi:hypothetical protein